MRKAYSISNAEINRVALSYSNTGRKVIAAITNGSDWSSYVPDSYTCSCIKAMLLTNAGIEAQNQTSTENAEEYIAICQENNINDKRAIVYCADILNQFGTGSFDKMFTATVIMVFYTVYLTQLLILFILLKGLGVTATTAMKQDENGHMTT